VSRPSPACWLQKRGSTAEDADAVPYRAGEEQRGKRSELAEIVVTAMVMAAAAAAAMTFLSRNRGRGLVRQTAAPPIRPSHVERRRDTRHGGGSRADPLPLGATSPACYRRYPPTSTGLPLPVPDPPAPVSSPP
jgi:hypothetical protein